MTKPSHDVEEKRSEIPTDNLKLVRRYYVAWNRGDIAEIEAVKKLANHLTRQCRQPAALGEVD